MKKIILSLTFFVIILSNAFSQNTSSVFINFNNDTRKGVLTVTYQIPEGLHQNLQKEYFNFEVEKIKGINFEKIIYPKAEIINGLESYSQKVELKRYFTVTNEIKNQNMKLKITSKYQFCNDKGVCFLPKEENLTVNLEIKESKNSFDFLLLLKYLLYAFIGGLILNVMPCVFPVLSIKALSLVSQSQNNKKKIFLNSIIYTGGVLVSFLILAIIILLIKTSGEIAGWGFQFQNPYFLIILTSIVFIFGLSLFDVFIINVPGLNLFSKASSKEGFLGSFFKGVLAVILATPCTAPFLGSALGFSFVQPAIVIITIFLTIGFGLALPFLLIGIFPALLYKLPKPGEWMNIFKEIMGFFLFATAIWLISVLLNLIGNLIINVIIFLGILSFASWFYGKFSKPNFNLIIRWLVLIITIIIIIISAIYLLKFEPVQKNNDSSQNIAHIEKDGWEKFSLEKLDQYKVEGKPVFIDFYAEWCLTCKVNEKLVLFTKEVNDNFKKYEVKLLYADYTTNDPTVSKMLQNFERAGVPLYVLYIPGKDKPLILPEILTKGIVIDYLEKYLKK
jgi:thiol:disulfide interchange protein DsbD